MNRIKEKLDLISTYDNDLMSNNIKYLIKPIIEQYRQELQEWTTATTHQNNIELYNIGLSPDAIWSANNNRTTKTSGHTCLNMCFFSGGS